MKKAYVISSENGIADSGEILSKTQEAFSDKPELLNEFWLRLAIDEFNAKDFEKSENYLSNIEIEEFSEVTDVKLFKNIYLAKNQLEKHKSEAAEDFLSGMESYSKKSEAEGAADSYYSTLLQCKIQNQKWEEIPSVYAKIKNPAPADRLAVSS